MVFGASGITGWAIVKEALLYPSSETFDRIIGLTYHPLTKEEAFLPNDPRINLVGGLDLTAGVDVIEEELKQIEGIDGVTHVYFAGK